MSSGVCTSEALHELNQKKKKKYTVEVRKKWRIKVLIINYIERGINHFYLSAYI